MLPPDTQAILLLCASFGQNRKTQPQPLTLTEYNRLAHWLLAENLTPKDLLDSTVQNRLSQNAIAKLDSERILTLLERGMMLALAVEKWTAQGLWILGRSDPQYPKRLKKHLKHSAPPLLYGIGDIKLLCQGGLAIVGSREVDEEATYYTQTLAETCATEGLPVISGGAKGIDTIAMQTAIAAQGHAVGVLACQLAQTSTRKPYRDAIQAGLLTLVSPYDPDAGFQVGNAMGRNKHIYALADYGFVVNATADKGGTWAGATEVLEKYKDIPLWVRVQGKVDSGNRELIKLGANPFPETPWPASLKDLLTPEMPVLEPPTPQPVDPQTTAYDAVLPLLLKHLQKPKNAKTLAELLSVRPIQVQDWLNQAVAEGKIHKRKRPVVYEANPDPSLLDLLR